MPVFPPEDLCFTKLWQVNFHLSIRYNLKFELIFKMIDLWFISAIMRKKKGFMLLAHKDIANIY
jgi:hypothetical protein